MDIYCFTVLNPKIRKLEVWFIFHLVTVISTC